MGTRLGDVKGTAWQAENAVDAKWEGGCCAHEDGGRPHQAGTLPPSPSPSPRAAAVDVPAPTPPPPTLRHPPIAVCPPRYLKRVQTASGDYALLPATDSGADEEGEGCTYTQPPPPPKRGMLGSLWGGK